ncbi:phage major capsid protein [Paenibacillus silviterrae]|uniref:phage major capsid protein n=1 Tax=Paenibacillus silviterrae TaxID=3242194 RepID=UPI0025437823|nr:phage major capsid protein [Paenibacillus chinjuensis]
MSKELRAMLQQLEQMKQEVRSFIAADKIDEAEQRMNDVRALNKKIELHRALDGEERDGFGGGKPYEGTNPLESREDAQLEQEYRSVFFKAIRRQDVSSDERSILREYEKRAVMHAGGATGQANGNSSLIVPQDIQTRIIAVTRQLVDLSQYVNVQGVTALSGSRVLEKIEDMIPFPEIEEYGLIGNTDNPRFIPVTYQVKKRGGILPLTNELLADSDQNIAEYVSNWIGRKSVVTRNTLILAQLNAMAKTALTNFDSIKTVLNVTLDPAISANSIMLTNQDGYDWMDKQKDSTGKYLLTDDITQPGRKLFKGKPVAVVSNRHMPSNATDPANIKAPLVIGDLKELIVLFSRKFYELASTKEGGDAFKRDTTDLRAIIRDDCKTWDSGAAVFGELDIN